MDHLSSTILMCAILLLFYATGTVKGVAFGGACSSNDACDDDNNVCSTNCVCSSESFRNQADNACVDKVVLEAVCADGEPATQCVDSLAECKDASGFKCLCKDNKYKSSTGCKAQVAVNATCSNAETSTDQCAKANSECSSDGSTGHNCYCTSAYYHEGTTCSERKKPNKACAAHQCVANAVCNSDSKCDCNMHYIATPTGNSASSCESTGFGASCSANSDCTQNNNTCSNTKCVCSDGSFRNGAGNACVNKVAVNGTCISTETSTDQCSDANSACSGDSASGYKCLCKSAYFDASGTCTPSSDAATIMLAHMHVFIFGTVASLYFLV